MSHTAASHAERFITHDSAYLLSHSVGLPVAAARTAIEECLEVWESGSSASMATLARHHRRIPGRTRPAHRRRTGGDLPTEQCQQCPDEDPRRTPVELRGRCTDDHAHGRAFPSLGYVCERSGYDVRYIDRRHDTLDLDVWERHLDDSIDVAIVTHVHSNTGELVPAAGITELARARDIVSIVDVAQSVGIIPIDVDSLRADFIIGSCVKWLSGGPGAGWLWGAPDAIERCRPTDVGWFSHADPFEFDIHDFRDAADALRFWGGSPTVLPFAVARASIDTIADIGVDTIRSANLALGDVLIDRLADRVISPHDAAHRSGTCIVAGDARCVDELLHARVEVDHRPSGLRVSPHVHTTLDDIERTAELIGSSRKPGLDAIGK